MIPEQDVIVSCTRCTNQVPINQTTYENNSKNLICFDCYNKLAQGLHPDRVIQPLEPGERLSYKCSHCSFTFSRSQNFQFNGKCFNCGRTALRTENNQRVIVKDRKSLLDY